MLAFFISASAPRAGHYRLLYPSKSAGGVRHLPSIISAQATRPRRGAGEASSAALMPRRGVLGVGEAARRIRARRFNDEKSCGLQSRRGIGYLRPNHADNSSYPRSS